MSTKFFTNSEGNTLLEKFEGAFKSNNIDNFDALIGYFHSSGYFKLRPHLENVGQIRILVGINVDDITQKYNLKGREYLASKYDEEARKDYIKKLIDEVNSSGYEQELEKSITDFVKDIASKKIIIKAHPSQKIHAKIYIFRPKDFNEHSSGEVITGSSNLTVAGLGAGTSSNYEFNVLLRDYDDIKFATDEFEKLWEESVEILESDAKEALEKTVLRSEGFTPFELYIKLLITYFGEEVNFDPNNVGDVPEDVMLLEYQSDAVEQGFRLLEKHNGFFLADVVGLGKTVIAIRIAQLFYYKNSYPDYRSRVLVVTPPAIKANWEDMISKFELSDVFEFQTTGSLHKITDRKAKLYDMIIIDESHKFRNNTPEAYKNLLKICKTKCRNGHDKKIMLVSATPLNNSPRDLHNQILLFQDNYKGSLDVNLATLFRTQIKKYESLKKADLNSDEIKNGVQEIYSELRSKVINTLTLRRTRQDLLKFYGDDLKKQKITIPKVHKPKPILYKLDGNLNELYDYTISCLSNPKNGVQYTRYRALFFLKPKYQDEHTSKAIHLSTQLAGILKNFAIKRFDSSFCAFYSTICRFVEASELMLSMIDNGRIYIAPIHKIRKYLENDEDLTSETIVQALKDDFPSFTVQSFKSSFIAGVKKDHKKLLELKERWEKVINEDNDPKFASFIKQLQLILKYKSEKVVVFSESKDTTEYIFRRLSSSGYSQVLRVDANNRSKLARKIASNFDANYSPNDEQRSDYNIIITTEALAEGVNLHRANTVINYDTPWNSTRLMQRIGRVNRIGTTFDDIYIYNFFPTEQVSADINLHECAMMKLHAFHAALGEDYQVYSPDETPEPESYGMFNIDLEDAQVSEHLRFLIELRNFRKQNPDEFKRIENLPCKARNAVANKELSGSSIVFLKNERRNAFYIISDNPTKLISELGFYEVANKFSCKPTKKGTDLPDFHHRQILAARDYFVKQSDEKAVRDNQSPKTDSNENRTLKYLKGLFNVGIANNNDKKILQYGINTILDGKIPGLASGINVFQSGLKHTPMVISDQLSNTINIIKKRCPALVEEVVVSDQQQSLNLTPSIIVSQSYD